MSDKALRKLQNEFLEALDESGFHKRNPNALSTPLFDKASPTALQLRRGLYPKYELLMQEYIGRVRAGRKN